MPWVPHWRCRVMVRRVRSLNGSLTRDSHVYPLGIAFALGEVLGPTRRSAWSKHLRSALAAEERGPLLVVASSLAVTGTRPRRVRELLCRNPRLDPGTCLLDL
jgi:hypothetical protein